MHGAFQAEERENIKILRQTVLSRFEEDQINQCDWKRIRQSS